MSEVLAKVKARFGAAVHDPAKSGPATVIYFDPSVTVELFTFLRDTPEGSFGHLSFVSGVDCGDQFEVVYGLTSYFRKETLLLKTRTPRVNPSVPSLCSVFKAADWHERETFDLFGIEFSGHPDLRRLLMPDDWVGWPLRKDYVPEAQYHGMPTVRPARLGKV